MNNIENTYINYDELVAKVSEEVIQRRIEQIAQEMLDFIETNDLTEVAYVHHMALAHAVMDYFSDVQRLKEYQKIEHINDIKIKAYETYWLLKRKPIQFKEQLDDDKFLYINEKFLLSRLTSFLLDEKICEPITDNSLVGFTNFLNTLLYYFKFRKCDAQSIELLLLAFKAGQLIGE